MVQGRLPVLVGTWPTTSPPDTSAPRTSTTITTTAPTTTTNHHPPASRYELFEFKHNLATEGATPLKLSDTQRNSLTILAMHPVGRALSISHARHAPTPKHTPSVTICTPPFTHHHYHRHLPQHGIIPIHGVGLWPALCDQYLGPLYGFGATTDAAMKLPLLRQLLAWMTAGSADRKVLIGLELIPILTSTTTNPCEGSGLVIE